MADPTGYEETPTAELQEKLAKAIRDYQVLCKRVPPAPIPRGRMSRRRLPIPSLGPQERKRQHTDIEKMTVELSRRGELGEEEIPMENRHETTMTLENESAFQGQRIEPGEATPSPAFKHSEDYISITFNDQTFTLTSRQAQVVQILHEAHKNELPDVGQHHILEKLGSQSSRLRDTFKRSDLWGTLIVQGKKSGTYRLNL